MLTVGLGRQTAYKYKSQNCLKSLCENAPEGQKNATVFLKLHPRFLLSPQI